MVLIAVALLSLLVFAVPVRYKYALTLGLVAAGVVFTAIEAGTALAGIPSGISLYDNCNSPLFGSALPRMDRLSAIFALVIAATTLSTTLYARDYVKAYAAQKSAAHLSVHYFAWTTMFFSMLFVVVFQTGFAFLTAWELMTISSFLLILFEGEKRETRRAAVNYLILMHIGFVFLVLGFVAGSGEGTLGSFEELKDHFAGNNPVPGFLAFLAGFGMKAGVFPLHVWLPEAHPAAPSHVSALMSGVMTKMGIYGILRVLSTTGDGLRTIGIILLVIGVATALWGIVQAVLQNDLKKLLACSSIENMGIIVIGIGAGTLGLSAGNTTLALLCFSGALLHAINHSLFKPLLFMGAGSVGLSAHTRNLEELGGLSRRMPVTTLLFLCGSIAICALPPFNGFVSEFLLYSGLLKSTAAGSLVIWSVTAIAALALAGGLAVLVFGKAFGIGFLGEPRSAKARQTREVSSLMLAAQTIPLAGILLIGFFPATVVPVVQDIVHEILLPDGSIPPTGPGEVSKSLWGISGTMGVLVLLTIGLGVWRRQVQKRRTISESPTWGCGFTAPNAKMQYTGESFAEGFEHMGNASAGAGPRKNQSGLVVPKEEVFAASHRFGVSHKDSVDRILSERWAYLVRKTSARLALFQTGKINHYILHALLFLALIFLISWLGLI